MHCEGGASCTIDAAWFEGNVAGDGGAISTSTTDLVVTRSMFCANEAINDAGAVDLGNLTAGSARVEGSAFVGNEAGTGTGGAAAGGDCGACGTTRGQQRADRQRRRRDRPVDGERGGAS
ncbi:MAG: hypothetical protein R3F59_24370 [Myxococcota bacterium]